MATRVFAEVRLAALGEVLEGNRLRISVRNLTPSMQAIEHTNADEEAAQALAARWNACADALAVLEDADPAPLQQQMLEVVAILRRAIYGDDSR